MKVGTSITIKSTLVGVCVFVGGGAGGGGGLRRYVLVGVSCRKYQFKLWSYGNPVATACNRSPKIKILICHPDIHL